MIICVFGMIICLGGIKYLFLLRYDEDNAAWLPFLKKMLDKFGGTSAIDASIMAFGLHKYWINLAAPQPLMQASWRSVCTNFG